MPANPSAGMTFITRMFPSLTAARRLGPALCLLLAATPAEMPARAADPQAYSVSIAPTGQGPLDAALKASSNLVSLRQKAPVGPFALITRTRNDIGRLVTALQSYGYYDGSVGATIDGHPLDDPALPSLLDQVPKGHEVPVALTPRPGPLFHLRHVVIEGSVPADVRARLAPVTPGAPALAAEVLAAGQRMLSQLREDGHALAKVAEPLAVEDKSARVLDVTYKVDAGPRVDLGPIALEGLKGVNPGFVRNRLLVHQGELFQPSKIEAARSDLASLGVFAAVRARAAQRLDQEGQLPLTFEFEERKRHAVSVGVSYATDLGIQGSLSWTDRNVFGNAESLVLSAANTQAESGSETQQPGYDITATFTKPDFLGRRDQSLQITLQAIRENLAAYDRTAGVAGVSVSRKLSPYWTASIGLAGEVERVLQFYVTTHYALVGIPIQLSYDDTNSLFEPTRGVRASFTVTPTQSVALGDTGVNSTFVLLQAQASTYLDFSRFLGEKAGRSVLALRGLIGSAQGATLFDLPPDKRFYAGGSATVRGYKYLSIGPQFPNNEPVGGLAIDAGTVELRQRVWGNIGAAAFVDAGQVNSASAPFGGTLRVGAGLGARYYTPIGPIRLDVAVPLNREPGGDSFELYIGLGEAF
ncbi:MAG TPA: BamA/TamA family outer membrane protein [Acetobacteraceae bacterium]|nr:BamA/TamA family outer membrane protein [Acetobacteraceae bacterium]